MQERVSGLLIANDGLWKNLISSLEAGTNGGAYREGDE